MKLNKKRLFLCLLVPPAGGGCAALLSGGMKSFESLKKPPLSPPGWLFPIAWTALYLLMGLACYLALERSESRLLTLKPYSIQLAMNFLWPILFFCLSQYWLAFAWLVLLWLMIGLCTVRFYKTDKRASALMLPYLFWTTFAGYLNLGIARLN